MSDRKSAFDSRNDYLSAGAENFAFDPGAIERANAAIERLKESYAREWAPAALDEMHQALAAARRDRPGRRESFERIYRLAHDMKGQGGTFGFPILSSLGESLCRLTADLKEAGDGEFAVLHAHIDAARVILVERAEGEGGEIGRRVISELRALVRANLH